jgi:hypothetical protein
LSLRLDIIHNGVVRGSVAIFNIHSNIRSRKTKINLKREEGETGLNMHDSLETGCSSCHLCP